MITKIRRGRNFGGLARYLFGPGRREEHVRPRLVASDGVMLDPDGGWRWWVQDMTWYAARNPRVTVPVWHCSLRLAPDDPTLTDDHWGQIAAEHVAAMGLQDHPWVAVRHGDDHIHLVACRVDEHGRTWSDSWDAPRSQASARIIEIRHGLHRVTSPARRSSRLATTTIGERESAQRRGVDPERARLRDAMGAAAVAAAGRGAAAWERELAARGVLYRAAVASTGRISGYSLSLPGWTDQAGDQIWLRASHIDRRLSWDRIRGPIEDPRARTTSRTRTTTRTATRPTTTPQTRDRDTGMER